MSSGLRSTMAKAGAWSLMLGLALALTACAAGRREGLAYAPESFNVPPDPIIQVNRDHRVGPSDLIGITVYRAEEVSGDFRVDELGNIMMPLIGQVPVRGMTLAEVSTEIGRRLGERHYVNPDVSVALKETPNRTITVDGAVSQPGVYPVLGRTTLMQAVAMARGASSSANLRRVYVFRQVEGQRMAAGFDLQAIRSMQMEDPVLYPSDIVIVDGSDTRAIWRDVLSTIPILALFRPLIY